MDNRPSPLSPCDGLPRDVTSRALSRRFLSFISFSQLIPIDTMRSRTSKMSLATAPASAGESDEDSRSKKRVRWESRPDDVETRAVTASDDFEGTDEEGSTTPDNEKVCLSLQRQPASNLTLLVSVDRFVLRSAVKGEDPIYVGVDARIDAFQWLFGRRVFRPHQMRHTRS